MLIETRASVAASECVEFQNLRIIINNGVGGSCLEMLRKNVEMLLEQELHGDFRTSYCAGI